MNKKYLTFVAFIILIALVFPFSLDFATSVVPGWHTTMLPPYFIWSLIVTLGLIFIAIGYWMFRKKNDRVNRILFLIHLVLTLPALLFLRFPFLFLQVNFPVAEEDFSDLQFMMNLVYIAWLSFSLGQLIFFIYFVRSIRKKRSSS